MDRRARVCDCGGHGFVPLTRGQVAFIDPAFVPAVALFTWNAHRDGSGNFYARRSIHFMEGDRRRVTAIALHRMVLPISWAWIVDHADGDTLNNRASNLRPVNESRNAMNQRKRAGTTSRFRGVSRAGAWWRATIGFRGRQQYLGKFETEEAAAAAYDAAAAKYHGSNGRPNFQQEARDA